MITKDEFGYEDIPVWKGHRYINFQTAKEMLSWVKEDKTTLELSHTIYDCTIYCYENDCPKMVAATLVADEGIDVEIIAERDNLNEMLKVYMKRLLGMEDYERLSEVKSKVERLGLSLPQIEIENENDTQSSN